MNNVNDAVRALEDVNESVKDLKGELHDFRGTFTAKEILNRRTRILTFVNMVVGAVSVVSLVICGYLISQNLKNVKNTEAVAKINCENANDSRKANRQIWTLVVDASSQDPNRTPNDVRNSQKFQAFIDKLYAPRDCNDLSRRYPIPNPPKFEF